MLARSIHSRRDEPTTSTRESFRRTCATYSSSVGMPAFTLLSVSSSCPLLRYALNGVRHRSL